MYARARSLSFSSACSGAATFSVSSTHRRSPLHETTPRPTHEPSSLYCKSITHSQPRPRASRVGRAFIWEAAACNPDACALRRVRTRLRRTVRRRHVEPLLASPAMPSTGLPLAAHRHPTEATPPVHDQEVGVLTFHRCINYGSYWQARCLVEGLEGMGYRAVLLDHRSQRVDLAEWRCALQPERPGATPRAERRTYARKTRKFFQSVAALPMSKPFSLDRPEEAPPCQTIVVGSDEVWNLVHPWYGGRSLFFGVGASCERLVAYAASFGNYPASRGLPSHWAARLRRFDALSVRDCNSRTLVTESLETDPAFVLDPCLQFVAPMPQGAQSNSEVSASDCIALYGHNFSDWFAERLRAQARRYGLRIVSIGYRNDWADVQQLDAGPEEFARLMAESRAVATNFFHGCVFALRHGRPFICEHSPYRAIKIDDLLTTLDARRHLATPCTPSSEWDALLVAPVAEKVSARIATLRASSLAFLRHALTPEAPAREALHA